MERILAFGLLAVAVVGWSPPSSAQFRHWDDFMPKLTEEDKAMSVKTAREDMTGKEPGTVLAWNNPETGNSGTVELVQNFDWQDVKCREIIHTFNVQNEKQQRWQTKLCHMKDGAWKWLEAPRRLQ